MVSMKFGWTYTHNPIIQGNHIFILIYFNVVSNQRHLIIYQKIKLLESLFIFFVAKKNYHFELDQKKKNYHFDYSA